METDTTSISEPVRISGFIDTLGLGLLTNPEQRHHSLSAHREGATRLQCCKET